MELFMSPRKRWIAIASIVLVLIACSGTAAYMLTRPKIANLKPAEKAALKSAVENSKQTAQATQHLQAETTQRATDKGCVADIATVWQTLSERGKWYKSHVEQMTAGKGFVSLLEQEFMLWKTNCAGGSMSPDDEKASIAKFPDSLAAEYKALYGADAYNKAEAQFKQ